MKLGKLFEWTAFAVGCVGAFAFVLDRRGEDILLGSTLAVVVSFAAFSLVPIFRRKTPTSTAFLLGGTTLVASGLAGLLVIHRGGGRAILAVIGALCVAVLIRSSASGAAALLARQHESPIQEQVKHRVGLCFASLLAYLLWQGLASLAGPFPEISLKLFSRELLAYVGGFCLCFILWTHARNILRYALKGITFALVIAIVGMLLVAMLQATGMLPSACATQWGWIRIESTEFGRSWRLQFPFEHHNRAGFFGMLATFLIPALVLTSSLATPFWAILAALSSVLVTIATVTRGALLGLGAGAIAVVCSASASTRKSFLPVLAVLTIVSGMLVIVSPSQRAHWEDAVHWLREEKNTPTSLSSRMTIQAVALELIAQRPLTGWGYGYSTFETAARQIFPSLASRIEGMSHPHNHWLEQAFAGGLPAVFLFALFTFSRLSALALAVRHASTQPDKRWMLCLALWFGLEIAIQVYGLTNTALRRNLGLACYLVWAGSLLLVLRTFTRDESSASTASPHLESGR